MRTPRVPSLVLAFLTVGAVWLAVPGTSTHTTEFAGSIPSENSSNHQFTELTIRQVTTGGTLDNDTVTGRMRVMESTGVTLKHFTVGGAYYLNQTRGIRHENSTYQGTTSLSKAGNSSGIIRFYSPNFQKAVEIRDSNVFLYQPTFGSTVCKSNSTVVVSPPRDIDPCSAAPTPSPGPAATGSASASPTASSHAATTPTSTAAAPYTFDLVGRNVHQDIRVNAAQAATIKDTTIDGNLYIASSNKVLLEAVSVTGDVRIERTVGVDARGINIGGNMGLLETSSFRIADGSIGGNLGCLKCVKGSFENLVIGGQVNVPGGVEVRQVNLQSSSHVTYTPQPPRAQTGEVMLDVTDQSLAFTHEKDGENEKSADVKLDVSAITGRANLELKRKDAADHAAVKLGSRFEKVIEFSDRNGNGAYDLNDLVLREYLVDDLKVKNIQQAPLDDGGGWVGRITYALPEGGTFALVFTAKDADPDNTKIDVEFDRYPYHRDDARLALQVRLESAHDWKITEGDAEDRLTFFGEGYNGFFSWIHTAQVDGADTPVLARVLEEHRSDSGDREVVLYLAYAPGKHIVHDPSIGVFEAAGVSVEIPPLGNLLVYGSTLVACVVVLWALGQSGRRKP